MGASQRTASFPALCCWAGCRPDIRTSCMSAPPAPRWTAPPRAPRVAAAGHARRMACMHGMCCPPRQRSGETQTSTEKYESLSRAGARDTPTPHVPFQTKSVAEAPTARSASAITIRATMMIKSTLVALWASIQATDPPLTCPDRGVYFWAVSKSTILQEH